MGERDQPKSRRSRLESEVIEILQRSDRPPSNVVKIRHRITTRRRTVRDRVQPLRDVLSEPFGLLLATIGLALAAWVVEDASRLLARLLGIAAVLAFGALYVTGWRNRQAGPRLRRWRGRDIDLGPPRRWR